MNISVIKADYSNPEHQKIIPELLDSYARDPMGGGEALKPDVREGLVAALAQRPFAFTVLAFVDGKAAGLANCFEGFSTFACKPLVNIHDMCVIKAWRGLGLSQKLLQKVEAIAREKGCCKITLEVLGNNTVAKSSYKKFGFGGYELDPAAGGAEFWQKKIS